MLVLTRKQEEEIIIDDESGERIVITILRIHSDKVSVGIKAPTTSRIMRSELLQKDKENRYKSRQLKREATDNKNHHPSIDDVVREFQLDPKEITPSSSSISNNTEK